MLGVSERLGFHTQAWQKSLKGQNPCNERALDSVLPERILALVVVFKHYLYRTYWDGAKQQAAHELPLFGVTSKSPLLLPPARAVMAGIRDFHLELVHARSACDAVNHAAAQPAVKSAVPAPSPAGVNEVCPKCGKAFGKLLSEIHKRGCKGKPAGTHWCGDAPDHPPLFHPLLQRRAQPSQESHRNPGRCSC
ncbi:MAG: hypothetical protein HXY18_08340 [Bryobacteraceae bacterium]|nr:hypothetical protein [Bryobacteraceae bacterium]